MSASFDYHRPASVDEALGLIQQNEDAKLLAGGHSLLPAMKLRLSTPGALVDIGRLRELQYIRDAGDHLAIGAGTTHYAIESSDLVAQKAPLLAQSAAVIGDPQVRNKGTLGGSLAHADPAADYPAAILATQAQIVVRGAEGERAVDAADYFIDLFLTSLGPDEIITEIRVPVQGANTGSCYLKFPNPASRFAVVGVAAQVTVENGTCTRVRVGITGAANAAFRDSGVESALTGQAASADNIAAAAAQAAQGQELLGDAFAGEDYRRHLCRVYTGRALTQASS